MASDKEGQIPEKSQIISDQEGLSHNIKLTIVVKTDKEDQVPSEIPAELPTIPTIPTLTNRRPDTLLKFALTAGGLFLLATQSLGVTTPGQPDSDGYFRQMGLAIGNNTKTLDTFPSYFRDIVANIPSEEYDNQQYKIGNLDLGHYSYRHDENWDNFSAILDLGPTEVRFEQVYAQTDQQLTNWSVDSSLFHVEQELGDN